MNNFPYSEVESKIGYTFKDKKLLYTAFVHSSFANENGLTANERLEFFGDAILEFVATEYLMQAYPDKDEGELSKIRGAVVSSDGLKTAVEKLDIAKYVLMSNAAKKCNTKPKKLHSNLFEAVLCAIYLDGGIQSAKNFVLTSLQQQFESSCKYVDYATVFQEYCQARQWSLEYKEVSQTGPQNDATFVFDLFVEGKLVATAQGSTKKQAKHNCAKIALDKFN